MPCDGAVTHRFRRTSAVAGLVLLAAGCNSRLLRPPVTVLADAGGHQISATIAEKSHRYSSVLLSFFPSSVPLHPGDALNFEVRDTGEPHSVAMGKLVDAALAAATPLRETADLRAIEALPQMKRLPAVFPQRVEDSRPRVNRSAAERCFLDRGSPPVSASGGAPACREREQPEFDGTQAFYSAGFLEEGKPFRVKLSPKIRPGTYAFMCLVHRSAMAGTIEVRPSGVERPRVADVRKAGTDEENEVAASLDPAARRAADLPPSSTVLAGTGPEGRVTGFLSSFIPDKLTGIAPGDTVTWKLYGNHSISFGASRKAQDGILIADREGVRINLDAWLPVSSPRPPAGALAYPPVNARLMVDGGAWSGEGTHSSGILRSTPPTAVSYTLTFAKPGTYRYVCLVHQRMRGRIEVSGG
jgi:plastocyanin